MNWVWALDPGINLGWAVADLEYVRSWRPRPMFLAPPAPRAGKYYLGTKPLDGGPGARFSIAQDFLARMYDRFPPARVGYEAAAGHYKSQAAMLSQVGLRAVIMAFGYDRNLALVPFAANQIKKYAVGKAGKKTDKTVIFQAARRCGFMPNNEHEADACWILELMLDGAWRAERPGAHERTNASPVPRAAAKPGG